MFGLLMTLLWYLILGLVILFSLYLGQFTGVLVGLVFVLFLICIFILYLIISTPKEEVKPKETNKTEKGKN